MVGLELVTDRSEKTPAKAETAVLFEKLRGIGHISQAKIN
jgi:alanine-glyoxylate transaminase/(R)-3-amino-2-methylpropionate-pyruvate transaminase